MAIRNEMDVSGFSHKIGASAEESFRALAESNGYKVTVANSRQERLEHWDFKIEKGGQSWKVEVKARKRFKILDENKRPTSSFVLIEWLGITGHDGWIHGKADVVAFESHGKFVLVPRANLESRAYSLCSESFVANKRDMLYKTYGRAGRQDSVSAILMQDVLAVEGTTIWKS